MQHARGALQCKLQTGIIGLRLGIPARQCIQHTQCPTRAASGRHQRLLTAAAQCGKAITITQRGPRRHRTRTRGLHRFEAHAGSEVQRSGGIGHQQGDAFALGLERLGVGGVGTRGEFPVDMTRVVAGHVFP
ncbi:hypothetical protein D3C71_1166480 [compost metagenome]